MTKLFFKSDADLQKFNQSNSLILNVLKQQRIQLDRMEFFLKKIMNSTKLQKQVDDFYDVPPPQEHSDEEPD